MGSPAEYVQGKFKCKTFPHFDHFNAGHRHIPGDIVTSFGRPVFRSHSFVDKFVARVNISGVFSDQSVN